MIDTIRKAWGWTGLKPASIEATNKFGNVIVRAADGAFWRICPEALTCDIIARDILQYQFLWTQSEFLIDWQMARLVQIAEAQLGPLAEGQCYCLKIPAALGGSYDKANLATITQQELLAFAGDIAKQIKDVPDGTPIKIIRAK